MAESGELDGDLMRSAAGGQGTRLQLQPQPGIGLAQHLLRRQGGSVVLGHADAHGLGLNGQGTSQQQGGGDEAKAVWQAGLGCHRSARRIRGAGAAMLAALFKPPGGAQSPLKPVALTTAAQRGASALSMRSASPRGVPVTVKPASMSFCRTSGAFTAPANCWLS
eukprot:Opistho-1_new@25412